MPSSAPGVIARGASRRIIPGRPWVPAQDLGRAIEAYAYWVRKLNRTVKVFSKEQFERYITLHSSIISVDHGCLGEVDSMVGDCRPPPPGDPRLPPVLNRADSSCGGRCRSLVFNARRRNSFYNWKNMGRKILQSYRYFSFNNSIFKSNLKILKLSQYFKIIYSSSSCADQCSVLEFVNSHYHLYGLRLVGPPSIAITNVLLA